MKEEEILKQTINIYDRKAKVFAQNVSDFDIMMKAYNAFLPKLLSGKKILDIGSGSGRDMLYFQQHGYDVYGVELSKGLIDLYPNDIKKYVVYGDMRDIDILLSGKSFDGIWSCASLVHMSKERAKDILLKSYNLLNTGGVLFVSVKYLFSGNEEEILKESISTPGVIKRYLYRGEQELKVCLESIGFYVEDIWIKKVEEKDSWLSCIAVKKY